MDPLADKRDMLVWPRPDLEAQLLDMLKAVEPHTTDGAKLPDLIDGCELLAIHEGGHLVGAAAVVIGGKFATVRACAATCGDFGQVVAAFEDLMRARGVGHVAFFTRRLGLLRTMLGRGYGLVEAEAEKVL